MQMKPITSLNKQRYPAGENLLLVSIKDILEIVYR